MAEDNNSEESNTDIDPLTIGELISLAEAAEKSGFTHAFLKELAQNGRLKAKKIGRFWVTTEAALKDYKESRSQKNIPKKYRDRG